LGRDVIELVDGLDIRKFHFLGLSLGGFIGQWLGIHTPERIDRLILSNTAAHLGPVAYFDRSIADLLKAPDMRATAETFLKNWFPPTMFEGANPIVEKFRGTLLSTDKCGLAGAWAAVRDTDLRRTISLIDLPTLVIAGKDDTVTSAELGADVASRIPNAQLRVLPTVHLSNVELPDEYSGLVTDFLIGGH